MYVLVLRWPHLQCALEADCSFKKRVAPETMVGMTEQQKVAAIHKAFEDAYKSMLSVIVLDDVERLLGAHPLSSHSDA